MTELMRRRRALMMATQGGGGLPSAYQLVEWIGKSSAGPFINTNIVLPSVVEVRCGVSSNTTGWLNVYGTTNSEFVLQPGRNGPTLWGSYGDETGQSSTVNIKNTIHDVVHNADGVWVDGVNAFNFTDASAISSTKHILLFGKYSGNNAVSGGADGKCSYFKVLSNGNLLCDLVPCYRKSDGEIGMYDLVSKTFLTNAGTGTFTKGADVI